MVQKIKGEMKMPVKAMRKFGKFVATHPTGVVTTAGVGLAVTGLPVVAEVGGVMLLGGLTAGFLKRKKKK